jgi:hypothetical protein
MTKMTGAEAAMIDTALEVEVDGDIAAYAVFGNVTGFAYATFATEEEAKEWAQEEWESWNKE